MKYYSARGKEKILSFMTVWVDFVGIIPSEVRQRKTNTVYHLYVESKTS